MSDYPYNLTAIATHLRELAQSIAKKLDISEEDAWDLCIEKLESKFVSMKREEETQSELDAKALLESHLNKKAGIYEEDDQ